MVPNFWLKSWMTGLWLEGDSQTDLTEDKDNKRNSVIDLTESGENNRLSRFHTPGTLFNDPPAYESFMCRHKKGICPSKVNEFKVISDFAFATIMSTLNPDKPSTSVFTNVSACCECCISEYDDHSTASAATLAKLQEIIKLVGRGVENEYPSFVLSKTWLTQLRKTADSLQKEADRTSKSVDAFFKDAPKALFERIDPQVNSNLCCSHVKLRKGFKRSSILVSRPAWAAIQSLCPDAIEFTGYEDSCVECVMLESAEESRREELHEERGAQLEDPALRELVRLLRRRPYYPVEFNKPEFLSEFSPKRFCLVASNWLRAWNSYILDISASEPGAESLVCSEWSGKFE